MHAACIIDIWHGADWDIILGVTIVTPLGTTAVVSGARMSMYWAGVTVPPVLGTPGPQSRMETRPQSTG